MKLAFYILQSNIFDEVKEYLKLLQDYRNPVNFSLLITVLVLVILYLTARYVVIPQQRNYSNMEKRLKMQNVRLMALFADLDPDPLLRIDSTGEIIFTNPAANSKGFNEFTGKHISTILPSFHPELKNFIEKNESFLFYEETMGKHYSVQINGIGYLNIAQIYLHDITQLKTQQEELEKSQKELEEFSNHLQNKIEEERQRISRELHDGVGQNLILLRLYLQKRLTDLTGNENSPEYLEISRILGQITNDLKEISHSLKPIILVEIGLIPALITLVDNIKRKSNMQGNINFIDMEERLDSGLETTIFRIVQEALSNIIKYSGACEFNIQLLKKNSSIRLIISDDGIGFDLNKPRNKKGMGIRNMQERAKSHNGTFRITSSPEDGTIIFADFPLGAN
ncbi:MAG TPA: sensor histidine kinase [Ignavibacteriales bacterium]|nr:sensor histidine kinase [Ignavibacteriales bacterium]